MRQFGIVTRRIGIDNNTFHGSPQRGRRDRFRDTGLLPPMKDNGRKDSALTHRDLAPTTRSTDPFSFDGGTDSETQDCLPSGDSGREDLALALKALAPLRAPMLRRESHPREFGARAWLLPPPRIFLPLTMPNRAHRFNWNPLVTSLDRFGMGTPACQCRFVSRS